MVDLVLTAANVVEGSNPVKTSGKAGATVTQGMLVYQAAATRKFLPSDADSATAEVRGPLGFALNGASDGQPLTVQTGGIINLGAVLTVGKVYVASDTPGGIMPIEDLETGDYVTVVGVAITTSLLMIGIIRSGVAVP